jgi:hypothetical protein
MNIQDWVNAAHTRKAVIVKRDGQPTVTGRMFFYPPKPRVKWCKVQLPSGAIVTVHKSCVKPMPERSPDESNPEVPVS